jgi:hypothetical protein
VSGARHRTDIPPELERHTAEAVKEAAAEVATAEADAFAARSWGPLLRSATAISCLDDASLQELYERMRSALPQGGLQQLKGAVKKARRSADFIARTDDGRPRIVLTDEQLYNNVRLAIEALQAYNGESPTVFVRTGELVQLRFRDGIPYVAVQTAPELKELLSRAATIVRRFKHGEQYADATDALVGAVAKYVGKVDPPPLPELTAIVEAPSMRPDGSIIECAGYDAATGYYYHPKRGFSVERVDLEDARAFLLDLLVDFPWTDEASRANAIGLMLTPIVRPALRGLVPLALITSPVPGAGKGMLMGLPAIASTGREASSRLLSEANDEARKEVFSALLGGSPFISFDELCSASLAAPALTHALTTPIIEGRLLGVSRDASAPNRSTWAGAALFMPTMSVATSRRVYWIELTPPTARPWERSGFAHPNLIAYALDQRARFVGSLLALCRHWVKQGCPDAPPGTPLMGQFHEWANCIGGILHAANLGPFLANQTKVYAAADSSRAVELLGAIHAALGEDEFTARDLLARPSNRNQGGGDLIARILRELYPPDGQPSPQRLGLALRNCIGTGLFLDDAVYELRSTGTAHGGAARYRVVRRTSSSLLVTGASGASRDP